jgi:hypothetical protein
MLSLISLEMIHMYFTSVLRGKQLHFSNFYSHPLEQLHFPSDPHIKFAMAESSSDFTIIKLSFELSSSN